MIESKNQPRNRELNGSWRIRRWMILVLFLPSVIYIPGVLGKVPYPSESALFTDLLLAHLPNLVYLKTSLLEYNQLPLWSNLIHSGAPFAANPLAGLFYLPGWLALAFPLPAGISVVLALHACWGALGTFLFLKANHLKPLGTILGSLGFGLMPKLAAHYGAGHVTLLYSLAWTPWLFLLTLRDQKGWSAGLAAGCLFLADPRWAPPAGMLWLTWYLICHQVAPWKQKFKFFLNFCLGAFLIGAPLLLPLLEYVQLSTRTVLTSGDLVEYSLPVGNLAGLLVPAAGGSQEWFVYAGGVLFGLLVLALALPGKRRRDWFWASWVGIAAALAVLPGYLGGEWLTSLPLLSLIRVPARYMFCGGTALAIAAALAVDRLQTLAVPILPARKIGFSLLALAVIMVGAGWVFMGKLPAVSAWGLVFLGACGLIIMGYSSNSSGRSWIWGLLVLSAVDLIIAGSMAVEFRDFSADLNPAIKALGSKQDQPVRFYSPSYSIPQHKAAIHGLELADGVDPLQLSSYTRFMEEASGVESAGYAVSIPAFQTGDTETDNLGAVPDVRKLGLLNVGYLTAAYAVQAEGLLLELETDELFIYRNQYQAGPAWIEPPDFQPGEEIPPGSQIAILERSPNQVHLKAAGPGRLVISEINYPGWRVYVDGQRKSIQPAYGILRSVNLPTGTHHVRFTFLPALVYLGLSMALTGWVLSLWKILKGRS